MAPDARGPASDGASENARECASQRTPRDPPPPNVLDLGGGKVWCLGTAADFAAAAEWAARAYPEHSDDPPSGDREPVIYNMTWTKLGDEFSDEARDQADAEFRTHVEALIWSNRRGLDLQVPKRDLRRFAKSPDAAQAVDGLLAKGWWKDLGDTWDISLRFADWQLERAVVEKRRELATARQRRRRKHLAGDHSLCLPENCDVAPVTRDKTRDGIRDPGRVGSGPTDPADPPEDQRRVGGSAPLVTTQGSGDGESPEEQPSANSLPRVHAGPDNGVPDAQQIPLHISESPATGGNARAREADGQADGHGDSAESPPQEPGGAGAPLSELAKPASSDATRRPAWLRSPQQIAAEQAAESRARREAAERAAAVTQ